MTARRSLGAGVFAVCLMVGMLILGGDRSPPAQAQVAEDPVGDEAPAPVGTEGTVVYGPVGAQRFAPAPSGGTEAVAFDDLSGIEQEATDQAAEILEAGQPPESVTGWSAIARQHAEQAAVRRAEYEAGLAGMPDGVE